MKTSSKTAPILFFWLFLCALTLALTTVLMPSACSAALPQTGVRFAKSQAALDALTKNPGQAKFRSSWEKIYTEFMAIYADTTWPDRPKALFKAAETLEHLARQSFARSDAKKALQTYEKLALTHKKSALADDALYRAALISSGLLHDDKQSLELLTRLKKQYPRGDMRTEAAALEKTIGSAKGEMLSANKNAQNSKGNDEDLEAQLASAEKRADRLKKDKKRMCWRQPWESVESELLAIHKKAQSKDLGLRALYAAAKARHHLADCSHAAPDLQSTQELYQTVYQYNPRSPAGQESLFKAASILCENMNNTRQARRLLNDFLRRYPKSSIAPQARSLLAQIAKHDKNAQTVALETLTWDSVDKNRVEITLNLTGKTNYSARLVSEAKGNQKHLFLDLNGTRIDDSIRKGVVIKGSLLEGIFVEKRGGSTLRFDLRDARRFDVTSKPDSCNLLITVDARKNVAPKTSQNGQNVAEKQKKTRSLAIYDKDDVVQASQPVGIASQLGLSIQTVFIDAGHGGKDPGTYHNNVIEKLVALDVAKTLGRLLENTGLQVLYSRKSDKFIPLTQRTAMANAAGADLFISIHVNANEKTSANGFETYFLSLARTPDAARLAALENIGSDRRMKDMQRVLAKILSARVDESMTLAGDIQRVTISRLKRNGSPAKNNGIKSAPFHVLVGAQMPAVLVELGYCSNQEEARKLASGRYREWLAQGLAEGILAYRDRLSRLKTVHNSRSRKKSL